MAQPTSTPERKLYSLVVDCEQYFMRITDGEADRLRAVIESINQRFDDDDTLSLVACTVLPEGSFVKVLETIDTCFAHTSLMCAMEHLQAELAVLAARS
jgi:phosphomannomutase